MRYPLDTSQKFIIGDAASHGSGHGVLGISQNIFIIRIGDESQFNENGRHIGIGQDVESVDAKGGSLHAAVCRISYIAESLRTLQMMSSPG